MSARVATPIADVLPSESFAEPTYYGRLGENAVAVVEPGDTGEVATVMRWASASDTRVLAAGTGRHVVPGRTMGGSVGDRAPYLLLTTSRFSDIEIYEPADLTVTAGAGVGVGALLDAARPSDQWLPFDPPNFPGRTLGGLVAVGRSGPLKTGYGELKNHVLGATVVSGDGRELRLGGRVVKNVAGFDLLRPVVGSSGSLCVITSVCLRLFPIPAVDRLLVLEAGSEAALLPAARALATAPILPASVVLVRTDGVWRLIARLHGAAATVDAEQKLLESHTGAVFEVFEGDEARTLREGVRDVCGGPREEVFYGLPADLSETIVRGTAGLDDSAAAVADVVSGSVHVVPPEGQETREFVQQDVAVLELERGLRSVFDPHGVFEGSR